MDRTERFYKIEQLIRSRGSVSFAELIAALEVSAATLKRDLQYLRDRMGAPIEYDAGSNGYRFGQQWRGAAHELPGVWFNEAELHALLTMQHMLAGGRRRRGGPPSAAHVRQDHPHAGRGRRRGARADAACETHCHGEAAPAKAIASRPWAVQSCNASDCASATARQAARKWASARVSPQRLVHHRNAWYLDAWCHASEGFRRFALDGVETAALLDQAAKPIALKTLEAELDRGYGIFAGGKPQQAELLFTAEAAAYVAREEWHPPSRAPGCPMAAGA